MPVTPEQRLQMRARQRSHSQAAYQGWGQYQGPRPSVSTYPAYLAFALSGFICGLIAGDVPFWPLLAGFVAFALLMMSPDGRLKPSLTFCAGLFGGLSIYLMNRLPTLPPDKVASESGALALGTLFSFLAVLAAAFLSEAANRFRDEQSPGSPRP